MKIICKRCSHEWEYGGTSRRISCSHCKTTITLNKQEKEKETVSKSVPVSTPTVSKHEVVYLPLPLADQLNKFMLSRLIGIAKSEGIDRIKLKINNEGDLYLPAT